MGMVGTGAAETFAEVMLCFALNQQHKWTLPLVVQSSTRFLRGNLRRAIGSQWLPLAQVVLLTPLNEGLFIANSLGAPGTERDGQSRYNVKIISPHRKPFLHLCDWIFLSAGWVAKVRTSDAGSGSWNHFSDYIHTFYEHYEGSSARIHRRASRRQTSPLLFARRSTAQI